MQGSGYCPDQLAKRRASLTLFCATINICICVLLYLYFFTFVFVYLYFVFVFVCLRRILPRPIREKKSKPTSLFSVLELPFPAPVNQPSFTRPKKKQILISLLNNQSGKRSLTLFCVHQPGRRIFLFMLQPIKNVWK